MIKNVYGGSNPQLNCTNGDDNSYFKDIILVFSLPSFPLMTVNKTDINLFKKPKTSGNYISNNSSNYLPGWILSSLLTYFPYVWKILDKNIYYFKFRGFEESKCEFLLFNT